MRLRQDSDAEAAVAPTMFVCTSMIDCKGQSRLTSYDD